MRNLHKIMDVLADNGISTLLWENVKRSTGNRAANKALVRWTCHDRNYDNMRAIFDDVRQRLEQASTSAL